MQNSTENGIRMVGMDQCRISSVDSTASSTDPLLEGSGSRGSGSGIGQKSSSSSRVAGFYSQKSRGSHSSAGSCSCSGGQDDCCGGGATEQEPLIPKSKRQPEKEDHDPRVGEESEAHINKLHFELFEQSQDGVGMEDDGRRNSPAKVEHGLRKDSKKTSESPQDRLEVDSQVVVDMLKLDESTSGAVVFSGEIEENPRANKDHVRVQHGSKDTVCSSSSSSSTTATAMVASTHSSNKSSKQNGNARGRNKEKRLRHLSTDTDDTSDISATLEPPDGGWGWVVVAASFLVNCIADGVTFSFGVFFLEFINFFKVSESTTAWIGSLLAAIPLLSGPIASSAVDRYGCRNVTIVGGLLAAIGFVLSSYTTSIYVLMITFGVITGFGLSLCYVAAVVIVAYYFERRRSFATGLSVCGGGIGTFLFAPISQYLIDWYGWQKTTLILAGAFLSLCLCGLLMKDLEWTKKKNKGANNNNSSSHHHHHHHHHYDLYHSCNGNTLPCHHHHHHHCSSDKSDMTLNGKNSNRRCNSAICIPTFVQEQERRERRQRYYSCNQDYDGQVVKQDVSTNELSSSRKSSKKGKNNSFRNKVLLNKRDNPSECGETLVGLGIVPDCSNFPEIYSTPDEEFISSSIIISDPLGPPEMMIHDNMMIPVEKDNANAPSIGNTTTTLTNNNAEIVDFAQNNQHIISRAGSDGSCSRRMNVAQTEQSSSPSSCTNISRNLIINNNDVSECSNSYPFVASIADAVAVASSSEMLNYQNNIQLPTNRNNINFNSQNQSNNSSVTTINNNINQGVVGSNSNNSRGLKRDNSGSSRRYLYRNKSYNNSINSGSTQKDATTPAAPSLLTPQTANATAATPNGIPTIIVPPGQQRLKGGIGNNVKLEMMNSVRYRSVMHRHSLTYRGAVLNLKRYRLRPASSCPDIISVATSAEGRGSFEFLSMIGDACRWMRSVCEWENLMNTRFLLFILSNLLLYTWYDVPYMYLQTAAVRHGYSEDLSSYLISSIGLFNVVGNIFLGYLGDKEWASATIVYGVCMIICGLTTVFMPYLMEWSYWGLFTICGVFGLTIAANYALTSVILVQVVSLERFANAYGLLLLVQGIGNLVGPPIAGVISDMTGTNTWSFLVAGVGIFASSFFVLAPVFQRELHSDATPGDHQNPSSNHVGQVGHNDTV